MIVVRSNASLPACQTPTQGAREGGSLLRGSGSVWLEPGLDPQEIFHSKWHLGAANDGSKTTVPCRTGREADPSVSTSKTGQSNLGGGGVRACVPLVSQSV